VTTPIRVLLVDDHAVVREGIRHVLAGTEEFDVVGEAAGGREALALARSLKPDVVLLDISMPGDSGLDIVGSLRTAVPSARVLMLSVYDQTEYVVQSVRAGAHGYLRKDTTPADLREAIRAVHRGDAFFSPVAARHLTAALREEAAEPPRDPLTGREREVLQGVVRGQTNKEIAGELGISVRTVEAHRDSMMRKLRIHTVAGLTRYAIEHDLYQE
jgi:two-component system nitrate/nitrite response regulator NarL